MCTGNVNTEHFFVQNYYDLNSLYGEISKSFNLDGKKSCFSEKDLSQNKAVVYFDFKHNVDSVLCWNVWGQLRHC